MKAIIVLDLSDSLIKEWDTDTSKCWATVRVHTPIKSGAYGIGCIYANDNVELKPMPKKIEVDVKKIEDIMHTEFQMVDVIQDKIKAEIKLNTDKLIALGWNACIDKILEEKEQKDMNEIKGYCKDCKYFMNNFEIEELDKTDYEDIVCTYHMADGFTSYDYCSKFVEKGEHYEERGV